MSLLKELFHRKDTLCRLQNVMEIIIVIFRKFITVKDVGTHRWDDWSKLLSLENPFVFGGSKMLVGPRPNQSQLPSVGPLFVGNSFPHESPDANRVTTWAFLCLLHSNK